MKRRHEERIAISVPVKVWGMDANGKPFAQSATTLDITRTGARLGGLTTLLQQGDTVAMQHGTEKARFRVVWVGRPGGSQNGQAGLHGVDPAKYIWGTPLERLASAAPPVVAPVVSSAKLKEAKPAPVAAVLSPEPCAQSPDDRRNVARIVCNGSAELANSKTGFTTWGTITDISSSGCYVETALPLATATHVNATLSFADIAIRCTAEVRSSHPAVGMGLLFLQMSPEDRERLTKVLDRLLAAAGSVPERPAQVAAAVPVSVPPETNVALSASVYKVSAELREVEARLASGGVKLDPRIIGEFRRTMDQARQTAWAVQQFLETSESSGDSYKLLTGMEAQRIRFFTETVREMVLDIDSQAIQMGTEGLPQLITAVKQLHRRLTFLAEPQRAVEKE